MRIFKETVIIIISLFCLSCSSSFKKLNELPVNLNSELSKYLYTEYKKKAVYEAQEMHDWNSAKLYSEKALNSANNIKILPQKISYWNIPHDKSLNIIIGYNNLVDIYEASVSKDPFNLAKAITSLDCWAEQQEENWQNLEINRCKDDFLKAMHGLYKVLNSKNNNNKKINLNKSINNPNIKKEEFQIVYFDFNKSNLSKISIEEIKNFINYKNKIINKLIIVGHTDTLGSEKYNMKLSLERANAVKKIIIDLGISKENIIIEGKGEEDLNIKTKDGIRHPANRRAEISPLN